jgi:diguanylate cyclase (GGDEF)-like protein
MSSSQTDIQVAGGVPELEPLDGQISCSMPSTVIDRVRAALGEEGVARLLEIANVPHGAAYLEDVGNWIWYDEAIRLFEAGVELTGDRAFAKRVGEQAVRQHAGTAVATLLRSLGSPEAIFEQMAVAVTKFSTVTEMRPLSVEAGHALVEATARPGFRRHRHLCAWTQGMLSQTTVLFGMLPAKVVEECCCCEPGGDDRCLYRVTWDAEAARTMADPQQLISALEAQVVAMKDRLESMYTTARDLIAFDTVEEALQRVTERAATAVRATSYLLAVRLDRDGAVYVHHRGFADGDPDELAKALLADEVDHDDDSRLLAEVASSRRRYGWLMAASPTQTFFSQERELLEVYARYAAAVLDLASALEDASWRADHDPLTEIYNRRRVTSELERQLLHASRYGRSGALLMIDLDNFKLVNDAYGHGAGDRVLRAVAGALAQRARETDVVGRLGGDEFAVLLPEADLGQALTVAEDIRDLVRRIPSGLPVELGGSVGVSVFGPHDQWTADAVFAASDSALYHAKARGRNCVEVYAGKAGETLRIVDLIHDALREDRFVLYSQPLVDLGEGRTVRDELLLRMLLPDGQVLAPGEFLPTAEKFGLSLEIDRWVTRQGIARARAGQRVAINLSGQSIGDREILESVRRAVSEGLDPAAVVFEITETAAVTNITGAKRFVETLAALGFELALDDFGTGFGSVAQVKELPARYLKIDARFVQEVARSDADRCIVEAIVHIAHGLGKLTVAEGVEDDTTLRVVRDCGVDLAQGFHLGVPAP